MEVAQSVSVSLLMCWLDAPSRPIHQTCSVNVYNFHWFPFVSIYWSLPLFYFPCCYYYYCYCYHWHYHYTTFALISRLLICQLLIQTIFTTNILSSHYKHTETTLYICRYMSWQFIHVTTINDQRASPHNSIHNYPLSIITQRMRPLINVPQDAGAVTTSTSGEGLCSCVLCPVSSPRPPPSCPRF